MKRFLTRLVTPGTLANQPRKLGVIATIIGLSCTGYAIFEFATSGAVHVVALMIAPFFFWGVWLIVFGFPIDRKGEVPWWYIVGGLASLCCTLSGVFALFICFQHQTSIFRSQHTDIFFLTNARRQNAETERN